MSGSTAQDKSWKEREQGAEAQYIREKEQQQYAQLRSDMDKETEKTEHKEKEAIKNEGRDDIEGGYGGQEDLEDRYATTYGGH